MKHIVTVNTSLPNVERLDYQSGGSLLDYDIVVFDPEFPYFGRIDFSDGGSCISIEGMQQLSRCTSHWSQELNKALATGKTVFLLLNELETDSGATGSTSPRANTRNYSTQLVNNYAAVPGNLSVRNAKGRRISVTDRLFKRLFEVLADHWEYRVVIETKFRRKTFATRDGIMLGGVASIKDLPGHLVLLPYYDISGLTDDSGDTRRWSDEALQISKSVVSQLIAIDKSLKTQSDATPPPDWIASIDLPDAVKKADREIEKIEKKMSELTIEKAQQETERAGLVSHQSLLFENGKALEAAIEAALKMLGYDVENYKDADVEIDHVIISPSGLRMIGESEGKDNAPINISKFRQLESNINEDFERDEVKAPAKGVLFGNGYRLVEPASRAEGFTKKCLVNADRLGTALVRTHDLYPMTLHILNNPADEKFKESCREAIESTKGGIVKFPDPVSDTP